MQIRAKLIVPCSCFGMITRTAPGYLELSLALLISLECFRAVKLHYKWFLVTTSILSLTYTLSILPMFRINVLTCQLAMYMEFNINLQILKPQFRTPFMQTQSTSDTCDSIYCDTCILINSTVVFRSL